MKKHISRALLLVMLISLASCGSENQTAEITSSETTPVTTEAAETFEVPELNYDSRVFTILACNEDVRYTYIEEVELTGDAMDDAIYNRNRLTEEHLGIKLNIVDIDGIGMYEPVSKDVMSGDAEYDMINPHILQGISQMVTENLLADLSGLEYIDFSKSWWNSDFIETLNLNGKLFYASGDMIVPNARVIVFNKQMMEDYKLPDIYEVVNSGKWTLDKLGEYTKDAVRDANGDGQFDTDDIYAFSDLSNPGLATSFVHGSNELFVTRGDDGFEINLGSEKMYDITTKLYNYIYKDGNTAITNVEFGNGKVLFGSQVLLKLQILRTYDTDFGIIPFPKYDESQDKYHSSVWNGLVCVPITAKDKELCGAVLETMAYYSQSTLMPAYYNKLLDSKFARDDESLAMLDLIFDGLVYDIGLCFDNFIGCYAAPGNLLNQGSTDLASFFAQNKSTYEKHYAELWEAVE